MTIAYVIFPGSTWFSFKAPDHTMSYLESLRDTDTEIVYVDYSGKVMAVYFGKSMIYMHNPRGKWFKFRLQSKLKIRVLSQMAFQNFASVSVELYERNC